MGLNRFLCLLLFVVAGYSSFGQATAAVNTVVLYDPLFWNSELKFDQRQYRKIQEINRQFYEELMAAAHEKANNRFALQLTASQCLKQRSELIWETFYPKQKRKWKKMWKDTSADNNLVKRLFSQG
jgi:hypothetical protein